MMCRLEELQGMNAYCRYSNSFFTSKKTHGIYIIYYIGRHIDLGRGKSEAPVNIYSLLKQTQKKQAKINQLV